MRARSLLLATLLPALPACGGDDLSALAGFDVVRASLEDLDIHTLALAVGLVEGRGTLRIDGDGGERVVAPVELDGWLLGLSLDVSVNESAGDSFPLELPAAPVRGDQVFGSYTGRVAGVVMTLGVKARHLENDHGVRIDQPFFVVGLGMNVGFEWLTLEPSPGPPTVQGGAAE